jgi:uncharacterized repeat protein (TIGR03803 family)
MTFDQDPMKIFFNERLVRFPFFVHGCAYKVYLPPFTLMKIVQFKTILPGTLVLSCLALCLAFPAYGRVEEGIDTLVSFNGSNGAQPQSILEDSAGDFYGTTLNGGKYSKGTVFEILQDGRLVTLVHFNGHNGAAPGAGLLLGPDGSLYGTTKSGGSHNRGTIFRISPDGKFSILVNFNGGNGARPNSGLLLGSDGLIYGATLAGGSHNRGVLFKVTTTGKLITIMIFDGTNGSNPGSLARGDDGNFYGTCNKGGDGLGLLFKLTPDGHFTVLVTFDGKNGSHPVSGLIKSGDGNFYGTTADGGSSNLGTVFELTSDGKFITIISLNGTNGAHPDSALVEWSNGYFYMIRLWQNMLIKAAFVQWSGDNFCGTTSGGGAHGNGTVFRVGDDGDLVTLVSFTGSDGLNLGANPNSLVPGEDGNLYGTTAFGGKDSLGTVFRLQLQLWPLPVAGSSDGANCGGINLKPPIVSN